jgi:mannose-6-phosphate isomerase-like protein (cupin superfamily)
MAQVLEKSNNDVNQAYLKDLFGVQYFEPNDNLVVEAKENDLYFFTTYVGQHNIDLERGDCAYYISADKKTAYLHRGPKQIDSAHVATVIRGYMPENKSCEIVTKTNLPYVNGCSTKQVFAPDRVGDPTLQILDIPPYSSEQAHHIHSTVRVAYILSGTGRSIVGMNDKNIVEDLYPGKVVVLEKMCPHHFETDGDHLIVLPLHVYSSVGGLENNHPMFNGTHMTG